MWKHARNVITAGLRATNKNLQGNFGKCASQVCVIKVKSYESHSIIYSFQLGLNFMWKPFHVGCQHLSMLLIQGGKKNCQRLFTNVLRWKLGWHIFTANCCIDNEREICKKQQPSYVTTSTTRSRSWNFFQFQSWNFLVLSSGLMNAENCFIWSWVAMLKNCH